MSVLGRIPFPVALALLAAATLAGVVGLYRAGFGRYSLLAIGVTAAVAVLYLREYVRRPLEAPEPPAPAPPPGSGGVPANAPTPAAAPVPEPEKFEPIDESEPFDDPVEEAARLDAGHPPPSGES